MRVKSNKKKKMKNLENIETETEIFQMYSYNGERPWSSLHTKYYILYLVIATCYIQLAVRIMVLKNLAPPRTLLMLMRISRGNMGCVGWDLVSVPDVMK